MRFRTALPLLALTFCISIGEVAAELINFTASFPEEELSRTRDGEGFDHFALPGTRPDLRLPGAPALPMYVATVVLPPGAEVTDTRVVINSRQILDGEFRPAPAPDEDGRRVPLDEYYDERYASYPDETAEYVEELAIVGEVQILRLFVSPLVWYAQAESIELLESISIAVTTEGRASSSRRRPDAGFTLRSQVRDWMRSHAVNGDDVDSWYPLHRPRYPDDRQDKSMAYELKPFGAAPTQWPSVQSLPVDMVIVATFRGASEIRFAAPGAGSARVEVFDASGRHVRALWNGGVLPGPQVMTWDGRDDAGQAAPSGVYYVRICVNDGAAARPVQRIR